MTGKLEELLERVRRYEGDDDTLEGDIFSALVGVDAADAKDWFGGGGSILRSVDRALAFVERELPGWQYHMGSCGEDDIPWACVTEPEEPCRDFASSAPTIPLACVEAFLSAKIALSAQGED